MINRTQAAIDRLPERPAAASTADLQVLREHCGEDNQDDPSSAGNATPPTSPKTKPWWQDHPEIHALKTRVMDEINNLPDRLPVDYRDPIGDDALSRVSVRELRDARDDLARAKARYDDAVRTARTLGLSWGQIGGIVGVSRQQLHRRYRETAG